MKKELTMQLPLPETWIDSQEDRNALVESMKYFDDIDCGMTHFQITHFVLNDREFPTIGSKYFQARKELFVRYQNLVNQHHEYRKFCAEKVLLEIELEEIHADYKLQDRKMQALADIKKIEIEQKSVRIEFVKKEAQRQLREFSAFWDNHQTYGAMMKPGVTQELCEPEHWLKKAGRKDKTGKEIGGYLAGPYQAIREQISHKKLMADAIKGNLSLNGHTPKESLPHGT